MGFGWNKKKDSNEYSDTACIIHLGKWLICKKYHHQQKLFNYGKNLVNYLIQLCRIIIKQKSQKHFFDLIFFFLKSRKKCMHCHIFFVQFENTTLLFFLRRSLLSSPTVSLPHKIFFFYIGVNIDMLESNFTVYVQKKKFIAKIRKKFAILFRFFSVSLIFFVEQCKETNY